MTDTPGTQPFVPWSYVPETLDELVNEWFLQLNETNELDEAFKHILEHAEEAPFTLLASFLSESLELEIEDDGLSKLLETVKTVHVDDSPVKKARILNLFTELFYGHAGRKTGIRMQEECDEYLTNVVFKLRAFRVSWQEIGQRLAS